MKTLTIKILLTVIPIFFISGRAEKPLKKETVKTISTVDSLELEKQYLEAKVKNYETEIAEILQDVKASINKSKNN
jgi:hypothetical protein